MNANDEIRLKTPTIRAQDDAMKTAGALAGTALDGGHPAVQLKGPAAEVIVIDLAVSAESAQQAQREKTAADTDTAAIGTVIAATKMKDGHLGDIVLRDHALAHHRNHVALHHEHWNDVAPSPRRTTHLPMWRPLQMHRCQKNRSRISAPLADSQLKAIQFKFRAVRK